MLAASAFLQWAEYKKDVIYLLLRSKLIEHLPLYNNRLKCRAETQGSSPCRYIVRTLRDMQEHCRKEHGWTNPRKRGRPYQGQQATGCQTWVQGVWCQKFQPTGQLARLFEVNQPRDKSTQHSINKEGDLQQALETVFTQSTIAIEKAHQNAHA